jgi:broad specificity phosphatase PhoE
MIVILVRHAERVASGGDPGLTTAGARRAKLLATMFGGSNVSAIFTSTFKRTKDTAAPLAQRTGLTAKVIADDVAHAKAQILAGGLCVVVVGHSDTVPALIRALGGPSNIQIGETEFDRMFALSVVPDATTSVLQMRYVSQ